MRNFSFCAAQSPYVFSKIISSTMKVSFKMVSLFCDSYTSFTFMSLRFTFLQLCYTGLSIFHKCLIKGTTQFSRYLPIATFRNNSTFIINFLKFEKHIIVIYQVQNICWKLPVINILTHFSTLHDAFGQVFISAGTCSSRISKKFIHDQQNRFQGNYLMF